MSGRPCSSARGGGKLSVPFRRVNKQCKELTMKTQVISIRLVCDRCSKVLELGADDPTPAGWGNAIVTMGLSADRVTASLQADDICPQCVESYDRWWAAKGSGRHDKPKFEASLLALEEKYRK